ncbi:MAG: hypothetical protein HGA46_03425 [Chlorobiaceae bacterium]|nr:hypothetical protein [Chlorobiaceae bacterium]
MITGIPHAVEGLAGVHRQFMIVFKVFLRKNRDLLFCSGEKMRHRPGSEMLSLSGSMPYIVYQHRHEAGSLTVERYCSDLDTRFRVVVVGLPALCVKGTA